MPKIVQQEKVEDRLQILTNALEQGTLQHAWKMLNDLHPAEIAKLLESLRPAEREIIWKLVESENGGETLLHLNEEARAGLIRDMEEHELVAAAEGMDMDDLADLLDDFPDAVNREVLRSMDNQNRQRLESVLSYPEDSAGGLMNTDTITIRADVTLDVVQRYLRLRGDIPPQTDSLIVVNRFDKYLGTLSLTKLLTSDPGQTVAEVM
ncbi:MAG: magnesium transporter, partial [Gammaproteobacteria bacterium]|nr:magnesium transporter [Gammaproteobacteria bacterium]